MLVATAAAVSVARHLLNRLHRILQCTTAIDYIKVDRVQKKSQV